MEELSTPPVAETSERRKKLYGLQVLRFFAAALVLLAHTGDRLLALAERYHVPFTDFGFSGRLGVDIFFVISGFIMGFLALERFGQPKAPLRFGIDRLTRVAPFYWAVTLAGAAGSWVAPRLVSDASRIAPVTPEYLLKSLLFIPYLNWEGKHRPILPQGWTLNFEMMFYFVFTFCLFLRRPWGPLALLASLVAIFSAGAQFGAPAAVQLWGDPIIFEFFIGFLLAIVQARLPRLVPMRGQVSIIAAILAASSLLIARGSVGLLFNAIIATLLVAMCTLGTDIVPNNPLKRAFVRLGDWSYSLYLTHGLVMTLVIFLWRHVFGAHYMWALAVLLVAAALAASGLAHYFVERPSTAICRRALRRFFGKREGDGVPSAMPLRM